MPPSFPRQNQAVVLWDTGPCPGGLRLRGCHPLRRGIPAHFGFPARGAAGPQQPHISREFPHGIWFGLSPFRSPLLRGSLLVSLPPPTKMFPFGGFPLGTHSPINVGCFPERHGLLTHGRRSHSGIPGSTAACAYPGHIAACRALRRRPSRAIHQAASVPPLSPRATGSA